MALAAQRDALDAKHIAEKSMMQIAGHEKICAERYDNIKDKLKSLPEIYTLINNLNSVANKAVGMWLGLVGLSVLLGGIYTVYKLTHGG